MTRTAFTAEEIFGILNSEVMDPEVPVLSVVELGIIRGVDVGDESVTVTVTPTYSGCPAMRAIEDDIRSTLASHGIERVELRTVYSPAWTTDWMSAASKRKLEAYGIAAPGRAAEGDELVQLVRRAEPVKCPRCGSRDTEVRSEFGSTACKSINYCRSCGEPFEGFKAI